VFGVFGSGPPRLPAFTRVCPQIVAFRSGRPSNPRVDPAPASEPLETPPRPLSPTDPELAALRRQVAEDEKAARETRATIRRLEDALARSERRSAAIPAVAAAAEQLGFSH
jgi:hypothetical protein